MKRSIIQSWFLLFALLLTGCSHSHKEYFPDGRLKSVISMKGKNYEGKAAWYNESGTLIMECVYHENKLDGVLVRYFDNGRKQEELTYKNNSLSGPFARWDHTGKIIRKGGYLDGKLDGMFTQYYRNGQVQEEGHYKAGKMDGQWFYYDPFGNLKTMKTFSEGVEK